MPKHPTPKGDPASAQPAKQRRTIWPDRRRIGFLQRTAPAQAQCLTKAGLALSDVARVEIHTDEATPSAPRRLGYRLARLDELPPEAPAHSGRLQI
jgi:hypothetical protein